MLTWSSWLAEVGSESTLPGKAMRLVLAGQRRRGHLGHHEARIEARLRHQEGRQAAHLRIHHQRGAALGERADLGDRDRHRVGGDRDRLGVEVAAGDDLAGIGEDQRVVGDRIGLAADHRGRMAQGVEAGAHHLGLAPGGCRDPAPGRNRCGWRASGLSVIRSLQRLGRVDLARLAAHGVDARIERHVAAEAGIGGHRAGDQGGERDILRGEQAGGGEGGRDLGAVEQRQPFLRRPG